MTRTNGEGECEVCGGVGYVCADVAPGHPAFGRAYPCKCRRAALAARARERRRTAANLLTSEVSRWTFAAFEPDRAVPPEMRPAYCPHHECAMADCAEFTRCRADYEARQREVREVMAEVKRVCSSYADAPRGWLVLQGGVGSGKSHLACAIAAQRIEAGESVYYATVPEMLDMLRAGFGDKSLAFEQRMEMLCSVELLILDDLGTETARDWAMERLYVIINHRYRARAPLVVTTNESVETLDARIRSRLLEGTRTESGLTKLIRVPAGDYRPHQEV